MPFAPSSSDRALRAACATHVAPEASRKAPESVSLLPGDVGSRRYVRCRFDDGATRILALYRREDDCRRFLDTTRLLTRAGVRVPKVLKARCRGGWAWLEDLGPETLYERFRGVANPWRELTPWYRRALEVADEIQALPAKKVERLGNPPLDAELLRRELTLTEESFLEPRGLGGWRRVLDDLVAEIASVPPVPCHRDFMVRNLMPLRDEEWEFGLGVLDHQDLRMGPPWYDVASLLNDSLFPPLDVVTDLLAGRLGAADRRLYLRVTAQRTLKAVGTFARSGHHQDLLEATLARARAHLARLPEAQGLGDLVE